MDIPIGSIAFAGICSMFSLYYRNRKQFVESKRHVMHQDNCTAVVILQLPPPGAEGMPVAFQNDYLISDVTKRKFANILLCEKMFAHLLVQSQYLRFSCTSNPGAPPTTRILVP
jgi:hypothetical protein